MSTSPDFRRRPRPGGRSRARAALDAASEPERDRRADVRDHESRSRLQPPVRQGTRDLGRARPVRQGLEDRRERGHEDLVRHGRDGRGPEAPGRRVWPLHDPRQGRVDGHVQQAVHGRPADYAADKDVLRVKVKPAALAETKEFFTISFPARLARTARPCSSRGRSSSSPSRSASTRTPRSSQRRRRPSRPPSRTTGAPPPRPRAASTT